MRIVWLGAPSAFLSAEGKPPMAREHIRRGWCAAARRVVFGLFLGLMLVPADVRAERPPIRVERLTSADGLSQSSVYAILQDRAGFMWLATGDGLNRYDGREVRVFRHDPNDPTTLADNYISALVEAGDGTLWVGTVGGGLDRFDPRIGRVEHAQHDGADPASLPDDGINALLLDPDGSLWVATLGGLAIRDAATGKFRRIDPQTSAASPQTANDQTATTLPLNVQLLHRRANGDTLVGADGNGLYLYLNSEGRFAKLALDTVDLGGKDDLTVSAIHEAGDGTLWLATANAGLLKVRLGPSGAVTLHQYRRGGGDAALPDDRLTSILAESDGTLWLGTGRSGLVHFDPRTARTASFRNSLADPFSLNGDGIASLSLDRGGMIWVGTSERGAARFPEAPIFEHYYRDPLRDMTLPDNTVWAFAEGRDSDIWVGTATGLGRFALAERRFMPLAAEGVAVPAALHRDIRALHFDGTDLWVGVFGEGVICWNLVVGALI
jgi:ligand-binding sensor domain-containing protein